MREQEKLISGKIAEFFAYSLLPSAQLNVITTIGSVGSSKVRKVKRRRL